MEASSPLSGLTIEDVKLGEGTAATRGHRVTVRYSGYLNRGDAFQKDATVTFVLGERRVIAGLERGVEGMKPGGIRKLRVSPHLGYGAKGVAGVVPPHSVLRFEVELLSVT
jgi:FKBP-type peptidyl-prolyl cis-trans isomerase